MPADFRPLSELLSTSEDFIDLIINQWLDGKLPLYAYFDGRHSACIFRRCLSIDEHKVAFNDIIYGRDRYQNPDNVECKQRIFVPETPLDSHLKITPEFRYGGMVYEYKYRGKAFGYWRAIPTKTARFRHDSYLLADYGAIEFNPESIGDITIHAGNVRDYIFFNDEEYIEKLNFYISNEDFILMNKKHEGNNSFLEATCQSEEVSSKSEHYSNMLVAFYLVIYDWSVGEKEGVKIVINNLDLFFNETCKIGIGTNTIKRCAEKPELNSQKFKSRRETKGVRLAFYHLLNNYREDKGLVTTSDLVDKLNMLALKHGYGKEITFNAVEVAVWEKKPAPSKGNVKTRAKTKR
jgi:hypothetical protein